MEAIFESIVVLMRSLSNAAVGEWRIELPQEEKGRHSPLITQLLSKVARWVPANMWNGYTTTAWLPRAQGLRLDVVNRGVPCKNGPENLPLTMMR